MTAILADVSLADMANGPWTDVENDIIVADYFAMLAADLARHPYNKAEHNRRLQTRIARGHGSIEYKHQNISAVLKGFGESWIPGYKPAFNFQASLADAVARWLHKNQGRNSPVHAKPPRLEDAAVLEIETPPTLSEVASENRTGR